MSMQFSSVQEFLTMGGHGAYVWLAVVVSLCTLIGLIVTPLKQQRKTMDQIARQQSRQIAEQSVASHGKEEDDASNP